MRAKLTPAFVNRVKPDSKAERQIWWDESLSGFGLQVTASGHRSFVYQYRAGTISRRMKLDGSFLRHEATREKRNGDRVRPPSAGAFTFADAKREAKAVQGAIARGRDPLQELRYAEAACSNSLKIVAEEYLAREGKTLRSIGERRGVFRRYIFPRFAARPIDEIKRSEIVRLLDKVEDENGSVAAEHALAALRRLFNWHAGRSDDFRSPIVRGMARIKPKERERDRLLSDDELRAVWGAAEASGTAYGFLVRFIALTATRLREAACMVRNELSADGSEWLIPAARYKTKQDHLVPLSNAAQALLREIPAIGQKGFIFTTGGKTPLGGFSKFKSQFDERVLAELRKHDPEAEPLTRWTTHDLRRTARSLMSRAGVPPDHAERAIGHVIGGVRGVYDRHAFKDEKRAAFEALAMQIDRILNPQSSIVPIREKISGSP